MSAGRPVYICAGADHSQWKFRNGSRPLLSPHSQLSSTLFTALNKQIHSTIYFSEPPTTSQHHQLAMRPLFSALQRTAPRAWAHSTPISSSLRNPRTATKLDSVCARCRLNWKQTQFRFINNHQTEEDTRWVSPIDQPAQIVRAGKRRHGPGLIILGMLLDITFCVTRLHSI